MLINFKEIAKSNLAGAVAGITYLLIAYLLDRKCGTIIANIIGLTCGAIVNFILQVLIFDYYNKINKKIIFKFAISELIIIVTIQLLFALVYRKYYNPTLMRILVSCIAGILFSYPLRKYWVFYDKKKEKKKITKI